MTLGPWQSHPGSCLLQWPQAPPKAPGSFHRKLPPGSQESRPLSQPSTYLLHWLQAAYLVGFPARLLGTQAPVSPWHLPAPMAPGSFCGPQPPNRLPQIQFPSSPWSLTALEAPGSSHGSKQLHWLQALRGPLQVQAPNTSGCQSAPTVPGSSAQLATTAPSSFLSSRLLEGSHEPRPLIHSSACCLPWTQAAPVAPGFWPIPVQAAIWGIRFQVGSHESTFLAHPNISQLSSPPGAPGRLQ